MDFYWSYTLLLEPLVLITLLHIVNQSLSPTCLACKMRGRCKNNRVWSGNLLALLVQLQQTLKNGQEEACRQSTHQYTVVNAN